MNGINKKTNDFLNNFYKLYQKNEFYLVKIVEIFIFICYN